VIGFSPAKDLTPDGEYTVDEQLYEECGWERIEMRPGDFVVLYPEDAHKPGIAPSPQAVGAKVVKGVAKIRIAALQ
jgi:beta-galactosidase beta subunit